METPKKQKKEMEQAENETVNATKAFDALEKQT